MANDEETFMVDTEKARKTICQEKKQMRNGKKCSTCKGFYTRKISTHLRALHHAKFAWGSLWNLIAYRISKIGRDTEREREGGDKDTNGLVDGTH